MFPFPQGGPAAAASGPPGSGGDQDAAWQRYFAGDGPMPGAQSNEPGSSADQDAAWQKYFAGDGPMPPATAQPNQWSQPGMMGFGAGALMGIGRRGMPGGTFGGLSGRFCPPDGMGDWRSSGSQKFDNGFAAGYAQGQMNAASTQQQKKKKKTPAQIEPPPPSQPVQHQDPGLPQQDLNQLYADPGPPMQSQPVAYQDPGQQLPFPDPNQPMPSQFIPQPEQFQQDPSQFQPGPSHFEPDPNQFRQDPGQFQPAAPPQFEQNAAPVFHQQPHG